MDAKHARSNQCWESNADAWTQLSRAGFDVYRDWLNTPAFFSMLPDVTGLRGLDVGCGEGHNTRLLEKRGARVTGIDVSSTFIRHAARVAGSQVSYSVADAITLPFGDARFDFVCAFMSLMDVPETEQVIAGCYRVLRPGGFLQFSITHPCFTTPHRRNLRKPNGQTYAIEVGGYFRNLDGEVTDEWIFKAAPAEAKVGLRKFQTPRFTRTLSQWLNTLIGAGFVLERIEEPLPTAEAVKSCPEVQDAQVVAYFLHVRARRPADVGVAAGEA